MAIRESNIQTWERTEFRTTDDESAVAAPRQSVFRIAECVNEILGYELIEIDGSLEEGYLITSAEDEMLAEEGMAAGLETLPPE